MVKVEKDLNKIPASLNESLTNQRREELIAANGYIYLGVYDSRYKMSDVKQALKKIYHNKCAFCESREGQMHVEHYRPKKYYYWLAYSWDNLLLACSTCNTAKGSSFPVAGIKVEYDNAFSATTHSCSNVYDAAELPVLVHPEKEQVADLLEFNKKGGIDSTDFRVKQTIEICKLDRLDLCERRMGLWQELRGDLVAFLADDTITKESKVGLFRSKLERFKAIADDPKTVDRAFRMFVIMHVGEWLKSDYAV